MRKFEYRFDCGCSRRGERIPDSEVKFIQESLNSCRAVYVDDDGVDILLKALSERTGIPQERVLEYTWNAYSTGNGKVGVYVRIITDGDLTPAEVYEVAREIRGQNSDGFGEGFKQKRTYSNGSYAHISLGEPFFERFGAYFPDVEYHSCLSDWEKECGEKERSWHIG